MIAWHQGDNTYWVSNSLLQTLTNDQMLGIARSAQAIIPKDKPKKGREAMSGRSSRSGSSESAGSAW